MISLLKTILGAGMLAMPAAFAALGLIPGMLLILLTALLSGFGLRLYLDSGKVLAGDASFGKLASVTYPKLSLLFETAMMLKCAGVSVSYLIVFADTMGGVFPFFSRTFWILASVPVMAWLSMQRSLESLKMTSLLGLFAVLYLVLLGVYHYTSILERPVIAFFVEPSAASLRALPVFIFAFTCHQNIIAVQKEAKNAPLVRLVDVCLLASSTLYLIFSVTGYTGIGPDVHSNILLDYPTEHPAYFLGRIAFALLAVFSFPLMTHPCRSSFQRLFYGDESKHFHLSTVLILVFVYALVFLITDLGLISALIGTFAGIPICYILPSLFYRKLYGGDPSKNKTLIAAAWMAAFGIVAMILCTTSLLLFPHK